MRVYELIAELLKLPAGAEVWLTHANAEGHYSYPVREVTQSDQEDPDTWVVIASTERDIEELTG